MYILYHSNERKHTLTIGGKRQMTNENNVMNNGSVGNVINELTTKRITTHGIVYELKTVTDEDGILLEADLNIITPAAFIIIIQNLTDDQVDGLVDKLISEYSYEVGECVSLKIPGSVYDCIFVRSSITDRHPLGYNIVEKEYGTVDGHEVEICDVLIDYISSLRNSDSSIDYENYVGFSILYDTEILPDDNSVNIIDSCGYVRDDSTDSDERVISTEIVGIENDLLSTRFCIKRGFSYEDITFTFHHLREEQRHINATNNVAQQ